ncbi:extracellular solute-binding protein [Amycolatopsis sp. NPDC059021]|uniref:extracellular solute-binding protein n=1 Tax=Amycolatopsis sp. NPDC059021 TaxID=3346704 RepID=UPI00366C2440
MPLSRRRLLKAGLGGALLAGTASCAAPGGSTGRDMTLWYWGGGLSTTVLGEAARRFTRVELKPVKIGGYVKAKLLTTMAGKAHVPDIPALKGQDIATFCRHAEQFVDLRTLGAERFAPRYLPWKWRQGFADDGRMVGFPIDTGPTALFYRADLFGAAGLPVEPADVARELSTWDKYFEAGVRLRRTSPEKRLLLGIVDVFRFALYQGPDQLADRAGKFLGDRPHVRRAWDLAVRAHEMGVSAGIPEGTDDAAGALANGLVPSRVAASWGGADIRSQAPDTSGRWRVAAPPDGPGNFGGSFLAVTKYCREPELAFEIITWLLDPVNQVQGYRDEVLFPSTPESFADPRLRLPEEFFGGQVAVDVFSASARAVPPIYLSPYEDALTQPYFDELSAVDSQGKDPRAAWRDALDRAHRTAGHWGLS